VPGLEFVSEHNELITDTAQFTARNRRRYSPDRTLLGTDDEHAVFWWRLD
jgi:hypothetical protein